MSFSRSQLLYGISASLALVAALLFGGVYLYSKEGLLEGRLILPIPAEEPIATHKPDTTMKAQVLGAKTIDNYPPNKYFPQSFEPLYGELRCSDSKAELSTSCRARLESSSAVGVRAYLVYDKTNDQILYGKDMLVELPIASLVKIMTAVVALDSVERGDLSMDLRLIVPEEATQVGEAFMGLEPGESLRLEDLLYGIMLNSGNDAAETLAYGVGGGIRAIGEIREIGGIDNRERFILAMNAKAQELGMYDTYFVNPTGLDADSQEESSFSTALDLLALTNYALENKVFRQVVGTKHKTIPYVENKHKAFFLTNKLDLEKAHPAIKGVKPGTTELAGNVLVSYGELDGQEYIIIMLNSPHIRDETVEIYKMLYGGQ